MYYFLCIFGQNLDEVTILLKKIIKFLLFLSLGVLLFWIVYRKQDTQKMLTIFNEVNYFWLSITIIVMLISHLSRSFRWIMLIEPLGKKVRFSNATLATFLGYFANMVLPRMGEVTRCAILGKYEKIAVTKLLGTVVVERAIDLIMFIIALLLAIVLQFDIFAQLISKYMAHPNGQEKSYLMLYILVAILIGIVLLFFIFRSHIKATRIYKKLKAIWIDIVEGFQTVRKLKSFNWFIFHTILIWICYYLMMYFAFKVFDFSQELSAIVALSIFVLGSLGMILPSPGGIGSFHFFVISGLILYMPNEPDIQEKSASFALLVHGVQTLFIVIAGVLSLLLIPILNKNNKDNE